MMKKPTYRNKKGGTINRLEPLSFTFNGQRYSGFKGDTLASALIANGVIFVGRSFKYHRPRGIVTAGLDEPNGLVQLGEGEESEPNLLSTRIELFEGLTAFSQNSWPSLRFDIGALNMVFHKIIPAGFYYKTFMWPKKGWRSYEYLIRKAAGIGKSPITADPSTYDHKFAHCDVLVIGGGPSGIAAALQVSRSKASIILVDSEPSIGGYLKSECKMIGGQPARTWLKSSEKLLMEKSNIKLLNRTIAAAFYDNNMVVLNQDLKSSSNSRARQRIWKVRAKQVILATGASERPLVFSNNDRPGVMMMSAVLAYVQQFSVRPGRKAVIFTNNNSIYEGIPTLLSSDIEIIAIVDIRKTPPRSLLDKIKKYKIPILSGHVVFDVRGKFRINAVNISRISSDKTCLVGDIITIKCDLLCISGGWTPNVNLYSQSQGKIRYDPELTAFIPKEKRPTVSTIGACNGRYALSDCIREGLKFGYQAAMDQGFTSKQLSVPNCSEDWPIDTEPLWSVPTMKGNPGKSFVDFQNDVTTDDIALACRENFISVEHLKRYTTLGMGTDQGRLSNINGLALLAEIRKLDISEVGTTTFRPPFSPMTLGAIAGSETDDLFIPIRRTPLHQAHETLNAEFARSGNWIRPKFYPVKNETVNESILKEVKGVREHCGIVDVSSLGKIEIRGENAVQFLEKIYINKISNLKIGHCRYGVMLREDGMVLDDGTITRLRENHFLITTTSVNANKVLSHLEYCSQIHWPELSVHILSVTDEWAGIAIAGPNSRNILSSLNENLDFSKNEFPFMTYRESKITNIPIRFFRISFSGELGYEINIPSNYGISFWNKLLEFGTNFNLKPYGLEAMGILRIEKGHAVSAELNGRTTANDLGFYSMMKSSDFIGKRASLRPALITNKRPQLVGLKPIDAKVLIPNGARIVSQSTRSQKNEIDGEITSSCFSPTLGHSIALALINNGRSRIGETVLASAPLMKLTCMLKICNPVFVDPKGVRTRG